MVVCRHGVVSRRTTVCLAPLLTVAVVCVLGYLFSSFKYSRRTEITHVIRDPPGTHGSEIKYILIWSGCWNGPYCWWREGTYTFASEPCWLSNCHITTDRRYIRQASVVIFHIRGMNNRFNQDLPAYRDPAQIWIFFTLESPYLTYTGSVAFLGRISHLDGLFNATMTYMRSSDFYLPYNELKPRTASLAAPKSRRKSKLVLWIVSNCNANSFRNSYAYELQKHIPVDIFGRCGTRISCKRTNKTCMRELFSPYKFYLAFENAQCKDYVTEKFWRSLYHSVVPVALGGMVEDYYSLAPPNSFLHIDNFTGPAHLAKYLSYLDDNPAEYDSYLKWTQDYEIVQGFRRHLPCDVCKVARNPGLFPRKTYNVSRWFSAKRICRDPGELNLN